MEESIRKKICNLIDHKYEYNLDDVISYYLKNHMEIIEKPQLLKDRVYLINELIKEHNIIDALKIVKERLKIDLTNPLRVEIRCCIIYLRYILYNINNKVVEELKGNNEFLERLYIRILLLEEGWVEESIEKFINKQYKLNYTLKIEYYKANYQRIKNMLNITCSKKFKGRPSLPVEVKNIILNYRRCKMREKMTEKYNISRDLNKLFTKEEVELLKNLTETYFKGNKNTLQIKLDTLMKYT
jgi:hypothetical protein